MQKNIYTILALVSVLFFTSCNLIPPAEVSRRGDEVIIEDKEHRYTTKIIGDENADSYLVYGFALLYSSRADVSVLPYSKAKQLRKRYGDMSKCTCKTPCGREYRRNLRSLAFFTVNSDIKDAFKIINRLKDIALIKIKYQKLKMMEGVKKTWKGEMKYRKVTLPYPYYLITDIEIIDDNFNFDEDL